MTKPEITFLVAISALAGFFLGQTQAFNGPLLAFTLLGIILGSAGSGMLNHYLERHLDARMRRTANRPLPAGRVPARTALLLGLALVASGMLVLFYFVNGLTTLLAVATVTSYLCLYTPLKRVTRFNTLIGCIPGALPALGGWTAATGSLGLGGWILFGVLFVWQMPHFLALAWMYRKDYARAEFAMLPVLEPDGGSTVRQTFGFTLALVAISVLPFVIGLSGLFYLVGVLILGLGFIKSAYMFYRLRTNQTARRVLLASVVYIPLFVACIVLDQLLQ